MVKLRKQNSYLNLAYLNLYDEIHFLPSPHFPLSLSIKAKASEIVTIPLTLVAAAFLAFCSSFCVYTLL